MTSTNKYLIRFMIAAFILGCYLPSLIAQEPARSLSVESKKVSDAYQQLIFHSSNADLQKVYLDKFPQTAAAFLRIFNAPNKQELFDGSEHIFMLENMIDNHPQQTLDLVMKLACELTWSSGAPNYLQFVLMKIAINYPLKFAANFQALSASSSNQLLIFMNAGTSGPGIGYEQLVKMLQRLGKYQVAQALIVARDKG